MQKSSSAPASPSQCGPGPPLALLPPPGTSQSHHSPPSPQPCLGFTAAQGSRIGSRSSITAVTPHGSQRPLQKPLNYPQSQRGARTRPPVDTRDPGARASVLSSPGNRRDDSSTSPSRSAQGGDVRVTMAQGKDTGPAAAPGPPGSAGEAALTPPRLRPLASPAMAMTCLLTHTHKYIIASSKPQ